MTAFYIILGVLLLLCGLYLFLVFPSAAPKSERAKFAGRYYAHRGLFSNKGELPPENSLAAFEGACRAGFGSELDVQFTSDGELIVFHDNDYKRACGINKNVWDVSFEEARSYKLFSRDYTVPTFDEVLRCVGGRAPLIIEIKAEGRSNDDYYELCRRVDAALSDYRGDYCIESFNPLVMRWWRKNRPEVVRGQLLSAPKDYPKSLPAPLRFLLGNLLLDFLSRPNFVAYDWNGAGAALSLNRRLGVMSVMWTVKDQATANRLEKRSDAIIFDSYPQNQTRFTAEKE